MTAAFLVVLLALLWAGITGNFSGLNLLFGGVLGGVAVLLLRNKLTSRRSLRKARRAISLLLLFLWELMVSAVKVALVVLRPDLGKAIRPALVAVPLTVQTDAEITLLANLITLTPGTLSVDVSPDRKVLYVHALSMGSRETLIRDIQNGFEAKVREVFE
jgi:multicomponent Na+:H+ antiporter subunit E